MSLSPRAIAVQGIGFGALFVALQGFAPSEAVAQQPIAAGGALGFKTPSRQYRQAPSAQEIRSAREAALAELARIAERVTQAENERAIAESAQRALREALRADHTKPAPIASAAPQPLLIETIAARAALAQQTADHAAQVVAAVEQDRTDQAAADKARKNRNRAAILIALLTLN